MRNFGVTLVSLVLTSAVVGNAYFQKKQFYPSVVYITKSNPSMAVIYIQAFILVILAGKLMRKVFFGELRAAEFEHLMERSWYAMTETCLAFTVFRDDFSPKFVALFTILLFLKSFHWLAEDRVDYMERSPVISWLFHIRVLSLLTLLGALDLHLVGHAYQSTITKGASVQLVFGFEYAILLTIIINIAIKYVLHTIDINSENPWENKVVFLLYTELIMGFFKVVLYILFLALMIRLSMLPLFAFRPMYYTMRAFKKAFNDVILSRRAIRNMNTLYPDATPEELAASNVCIICREEMTTASKKLPCNHIFHTSCLRSWFQRQQTCPTCRLNILRTTPTTQPPRGPAARPQAAHANAPDQRQPPAFQPPPFPFVWAPQQQQQQQQPAGGEQNNAGTATSSGEVPPPMPNNMPFFCPPFPFMPFGVPPPMPPADFTGLSEEELRRMEEAGRTGVEARLRCLRNIQLLLDTSVIMMQQYVASAATSVSNSSANTATSSASDVTPSTSTAVSSGPTATPTTSSVVYSESTATPSPSKLVSSATTAPSSPSSEESADSTAPFPTSTSSESTTVQKTDNDRHSTQTPDLQTPSTSFINSESNTLETSSSSESIPKTSTTPELEEARRRRLQKFL